MIVALSMGVIALTATVVALAIRHIGVHEDKTEEEAARKRAEKQLKTTSSEFAAYRKSTKAQLQDLRNDIRQLESDLEACTDPRARVQRLERLLSKARDPQI